MDKKKVILFIFIAALLIRIFFAYLGFSYPKPEFPGSDSMRFDTIALNLSLGKGFVANGVPATDRAPFYVFFLAVIYFIFGHNYLAVIFFQSVISALTCVVVFGIAKKIFSVDIAIFSSILCAIFPPLIGINNYIISEPIYTFLSCVMIYYFLQFLENPCFKNSLIAGSSFGIGMLSRPFLVFLFILTVFSMFVYNIRNKVKKSIFLILVFLFVGLFVTAPWAIRNYVISKRFIPITMYAGFNFYAATAVDEVTYRKINAEWNPGQGEWEYVKLALSSIGNHPLGYITVSLRRFFNAAIHSYTDALGLEKIETAEHGYKFFIRGVITWPFLIRAVMISCCMVIYIFALFGFFSNNYVVGSFAKRYVLYFLFTYLFLITFISPATTRFYSPAYPLVLIFSSQTIYRLFLRRIM